MIPFLVKRISLLVLTLWAVFTISFYLMEKSPGGPLQSEKAVSPEVMAAMREQYHLNETPLKRYWIQLTNALQGNLGRSWKLKDFTVNEVLAAGFPISASLGIFSLTLALAVGITAGVVAALWRQTAIDYGAMLIATVGIAVPNFVLASVMILIFVFRLGWFPAAGWGSLSQLVLPVVCLSAPFAAYIARLARTGMLEVLSKDYIRTAYAKGLPGYRVVIRHALRGALLPVVSYLGPATAGVLTGSLVIEQMFAIPGMGSHFVQAAIDRDLSLAMGAVLVYTLLVCTMNLLVDISYVLLDPRVKLE